jgi:AcrR family transcriptional regulator
VPKQTFLNLSAEKRQAFVEIALEEFANHDYHTASVSKIVARAGIAKGSVYQYFEDKQDLFLYLLEVANQALMGFIGQTAPPVAPTDFFETLRWQMSASVLASQRHPLPARLVQRAYSAPLPFREAVLEQGKQLRQAHFQALVTQAQAAGQLDAGLDPAVVTFMVQGLMNELGPFLVARFGKRKRDWTELPEVSAIFDQVIETLRRGLAARA